LRDDVRLRALAVGTGLIPPRAMHSADDAALLLGLARDARRVVEIGVYEGASAIALCGVLPAGAELHLVDPFGRHPDALPSGWGATEWATRRVVARALRARRRQLGAGVLEADGSETGGGEAGVREAGVREAGACEAGVREAGACEAGEGEDRGHEDAGHGAGGPVVHWHTCLSADLARNWHGEVDLVFIDGDHSESGCELDWVSWHPFVAPSGHVVFHDARAGISGGRGLPGPTAVVTRHFRRGGDGAGAREGGEEPSAPGWKIVAEADRTVAVSRVR
jgi:Methyltransferase domain